jgi:O-methyltransferase involved in polyketide biosynthesis
VWLAEGLFFYLTEAAVHALLGGASALAPPLSQLGADFVNRDLLASPVMWPLLGTFSRRGAPGRFGTNDPEALFAEHGWEAEVIQPGESEADYGRWPYPVAPRQMPGVPRLFLVRARRA